MLVLTIISVFLCFFFQESNSQQPGCANQDPIEKCCTSALVGWFRCPGTCGTGPYFFPCICSAGRYSGGGAPTGCFSMAL